ncbi:MAG: deoxyribodipyrimidine photo-lyase [Patescibacteria group bacterium]|nr:deoxyribodipyrimidine photo-lyase [Patescibacteria group bacterium]
MKETRVRKLNSHASGGTGPVVYLMSRDQRVQDNAALTAAQEYALERKRPLLVFFSLFTQPVGRLMQQYEFMLTGLKEVEEQLHANGIGFLLRTGTPEQTVPAVLHEYDACALFLDFSPLRNATTTRVTLAQTLQIPVFEVDATHVVPLWVASDREEFAARTLRPKIHRVLERYLVAPEPVVRHPFPLETQPVDWSAAHDALRAPRPAFYAPPFEPGEAAASRLLREFIKDRLERYGEDRNKPHLNGTSGLSPYLHFGQLSALRAVLTVREAVRSAPKAVRDSAEAFIEELVVRRELAANYCYYQKNYTSLDGAKPWARQTLYKHTSDPREFIYSLDEFEQAATHEPAWNAAQRELLTTGKMHGYMRMYWAKKILEWTATPQEAIEIAVYLNDRYHLDGFEANGYAGIMWAIAGVHDRPWFERPVYGSIRYMNANGLRRKFDLDAYIRAWSGGQLRI